MTIQPFASNSFSNFGELLKYLRRRERLTQLELSITVGYSEAQISRLEQNQRLPDLAALKALFIPALHLENVPELTKRLLELAQSARQEDAPAPGIAPYKGLLCFDESDAELFFGREALTIRLAKRVTDLARDAFRRFLAVVGASGSGKSSLVRAGLAVALKRAGWEVHVFTPTSDPMRALEVNLAAPRLSGSWRVLILVDQFEEMFTLCHDEPQRVAFVEELLNLAQDPAGQTVVVIALRADFYSRCSQYAVLREAAAAEQEYIGQMTTEELRRAIDEPAKRGGWEFEPGLVDVLLNDIGARGAAEAEPGGLPLLSHALLATWERRRGRTFTMEGYRASGGVRGAIAETAESVFTDQLNAEQQELAREVFLRLTELGEGTEDTRRRAALTELVRQAEEATQLRGVLNTLAEARLITLNGDSAEVAHEALIREWQRLHEWLTEDREGLRLHRHLTESAREWESRGRDPGELYRAVRLAQAREWALANAERLNQSERNFLAASVDQEQHDVLEREAQRQRDLEFAQELAESKSQTALQLRRRAVILSAAFVVAIALAAIALFFDTKANRFALQAGSSLATAQAESRIRATAQANAEASFARAEAQRLAAEANTLLQQQDNSELIALLSIRSMNIQYSPQGDAALTGAASLDYPLQIFTGHSDGLYAVAYSPDGKSVLTGSTDETARLWDAETGAELRRFIGHTAAVEAVAFSPDGRFAGTGGLDATARLWDVKTGKELRTFTDAATDVFGVKFSPDGKTLLTGNGDGIARLWDVRTGALLRRFIGHTDQIWAVGFSPDGKTVFTGSTDKTARLWEMVTGAQLHIFSHTDSVASGAFSPDGKTLLTTTFGGVAYLWDVETGNELHALTGHVGAIWASAYAPSGKYVATGGDDGTTRLWDPQTGVELRRYTGHIALVTGVAFSPDSKHLVTGSYDSSARLWEVEPISSPPPFDGDMGGVWNVAFSPDGHTILTGGEDGTMRLWNARTGAEIRRFIGHDGTVTAVAFSPDGRFAASGGYDATVRLWDVQTGEQMNVLLGHTLDIGQGGVAFSPDGKYILSGSSDKTARLWDVQTGKDLRTFAGGTEPVWSVGFSSDGRYVLIGYPTSIRQLDVLTGREVRTFDGSGGSLTLSLDGRFLLTCGCGSDRAPKLWDFQTGQLLRAFTGNTGQVPAVAFSPDGRHILSGGYDNTARMWDTQSGQEERRFSGHSGVVNSVKFSPDGKYVLTGSSDGTIRLWIVDYHQLLEDLCSRLLRDLTADERTQYNITDTTATCPSIP
jgi:WD40 repeat protein/transcriptional regulator with XRE-family HTH domain